MCSVSRFQFNIGFRFYYWNIYKTMKSQDQHPNNRFDHAGYEPYELYIDSKYKSLKEEIMNNTIFTLNTTEFQISLTKAREYIHSEIAKAKKACDPTNFNKCYKLYDIKPKSPITMEHLLAVILLH